MVRKSKERTRDFVNQQVLDRIIEWADDIEDFESHHAVDGLFHAQGYRAILSPWSEESLFQLGLACTYWFWMDDRSDDNLSNESSPVQWERLIRLEYVDVSPLIGDSEEEKFFYRLSNVLKKASQSDEEYRRWHSAAIKAFRGMYFEELFSRSGKYPSLIESIERGTDSTTILSMMAAASLVQGLDRPARDGDLLLQDLERRYCAWHRVINDLETADKERREGSATTGRVSNMVLLLEQTMSQEQARNFVMAQYDGIIRLIESDMTSIGSKDPFVRMIRRGLDNTKKWYASGPQRYQKEHLEHSR